MKTFKDWEEQAVRRETIAFGYMSRNCRDIYDMLSHTVVVEVYMPWNVFKPNTVQVHVWEFQLKPDHPIMELARKHGAEWTEHPYAEDGMGYPFWHGEDDRCEECWNFLQEYNATNKQKETQCH